MVLVGNGMFGSQNIENIPTNEVQMAVWGQILEWWSYKKG